MQQVIWLMMWLVAALAPAPLSADESRVVINEIMWAREEYLELYNATEDEVNLTGWKLQRQRAGQDPEDIVTFGESDKIAGHSFYVLQMSNATSVEADKALPSNRLVDTGLLLLLVDEAGSVVDRANRIGSWFAGKNEEGGKSMERISADGSGEEASSWRTSTGQGGGRHGTPRASNSEEAANTPPVAVITAPAIATVGQSISFSAAASTDEEGDSLTYHWNFGNGDEADGVTATYAYVTAGSFTALLTVSDGVNTASASADIQVTAAVYSDAVVINEFLPNPTGVDTNNEFIELFNTGDVAVDISGWRLDDIEGGSAPYVFPAGSLLLPQSITAYFESTTNITLNNDADAARLLSPDGAVKSQVVYTGSPAEGQSYNRVEASYVLSTTSTPRAVNTITTIPSPSVPAEQEADTVYPTTITVNEFLPNPLGSDSELEFIEIKNTGSEEISLAGWKIDDGDGGSTPFTLGSDVKIVAGGLLVFYSRDTHLSLSNSGDTVRVLDPNGVVVSSFVYASSQEEVSWNRVNEGYQESTTLTPGGENVITAPAEEATSSVSGKSSTASSGQVAGSALRKISLALLRSLSLGSVVEIQGVVSVPPDVFGKTLMYVAGSGVQVYSSKGFPALQLGDMVTIQGKISSIAKELRILVSAPSDIVRVKSGEAPVPHVITTGEVGEAWEGSLVAIEGAVTRSQGSTFYIDDGSGEIRIFIRDSVVITRPRLSKGMKLAIIGVVSQTEAGYRVMPRWQEDFTVVGAVPITAKATTSRKRAVQSVPGEEQSMSEATQVPFEATSSSSQIFASGSPLVTPTTVFAACMAAMALLVAGFQSQEPLLALTARRV